jgi:hypothetical protein
MMCGNYLPNPANYAHKYIRGDGTMSEIGLRPRKEGDFCIRKSECTQQMQSLKNKAKIMKGGVLTSTCWIATHLKQGKEPLMQQVCETCCTMILRR